MKYTVVSLAIIISCVLSAAAQTSQNQRKFKHSEKIITKYDKTKNLTTVLLRSNVKDSNTGPMDEITRIDLLVGFAFEGEKSVEPPKAVELALEIGRSKRRTDKSNIPDFIIEIDGDEINLGQPKLLGSAVEDVEAQVFRLSLYTETIAIRLPADILQKITSGKKVRFQTGDVKVKLKDKHLEALRDLASRMN